MPDSVAGVPIHPLVVHAVVVLLPLAALGVFLLAVVPPWRKSYASVVLVVTAVAIVLVPIASASGETLKDAVDGSAALDDHADAGQLLIWFSLPLLAAAVALWWLGRKARAGRPVGRALSAAVAVVSVVAALAVSFQVVLVGYTGARSVWEGKPSANSGADQG